MVQLNGPTSDDLGLMGDVFTAAVWEALNRTLETTANKLHGFISVEDISTINQTWADEVDAALLDHVDEAFTLGAGITRINQMGAVIAALQKRSAVTASVDAGDTITSDETPFDIPLVQNANAVENLKNARNRLVAVGDDVWGAARTQLVQGMQAGEGISSLKQRVKDSVNFSAARAEVVARSEMSHAMNQGSLAQMTQLTAVTMTKEWIATHDGRTRPEHLAVDGEKQPIDHLFSTGDNPGDEPNCRCTLGYDIPDDDVAGQNVDTGEQVSSEESFVQQGCGCSNALRASLVASAMTAFAKYDPAYAAAYRAKKKAEREGKKAEAPKIEKPDTSGLIKYVPPQGVGGAETYLTAVEGQANKLASPCACPSYAAPIDTGVVSQADVSTFKVAWAKGLPTNEYTAAKDAKKQIQIELGNRLQRDVSLEESINFLRATKGQYGEVAWWDKGAVPGARFWIDEYGDIIHSKIKHTTDWTEVTFKEAVSRGVANKLVKQWSLSSADSDFISLASQIAAREEFGLDAKVLSRDKFALEKAETFFKTHENVLRSFMRQQYDYTQRFFGDVEYVKVYRGMEFSEDQLPDWLKGTRPGDAIGTVKLQPISSFAWKKTVADEFSGGGITGRISVILSARVPRRAILGSARTGLGCLSETEVVVIGEPGEFKIERIIKPK